jgi:hypothetical protein
MMSSQSFLDYLETLENKLKTCLLPQRETLYLSLSEALIGTLGDSFLLSECQGPGQPKQTD